MLILIICIIFLLILIYLGYKYVSVPGKIVWISEGYNNELKDFESRLRQDYPLGNDSFRISHGPDYYAFFKRLGKVYMKGSFKDGELIGVGCGVLRKIKCNREKWDTAWDTVWDTVWYMCDLKVTKKYRRRHIILKMLIQSMNKLSLSNKVYGISMNNNTDNITLKLAKRIPFLNFKEGPQLMIYSLNYDKLIIALPIVKKYRGNISFLSLNGIKDLILKSTGEPMKLLHLQWTNDSENDSENYTGKGKDKTNTDNINDLKKDYTYMFCCPKNDPMYKELKKVNIETEISATIIHYNMDDCDWKFIMTSEI